ncbi:hypothetical protein ATANTOWER_025003 [Ataeniobius toweri]|uniref:Uncharacterized protein n=1 Tax=Ataeniobius toweri TaxID=208326 RepID=A0ABU7C0L7_9TELE|nr:hypothetical protein [Ataeniobius toweri]
METLTLDLLTLNSHRALDTERVNSLPPPPEPQVPTKTEDFALHFSVFLSCLPRLEMLAKVEYGVQKYIKVPQSDECFHFLQFLQDVLLLSVMEKFSFQPLLFKEGVLVLTDTSDTEVDSDIFDELVKTGVRAFKVGYRKQQQILTSVWLKMNHSHRYSQSL